MNKPHPIAVQFNPALLTKPLALASTFAETNNQELNDVLRKIQTQYILPAHLPEKQRSIVFDPRKASFMQSNPIDLEIDGMEHRFAPMSLFRLENSKKLYKQALKEMKTQEDWEQLQVLLAGFRKAGIILKPHTIGMAVRLAGMNGQIYSIIECAKQAQQTGVSFSNKEVMLRTFQFINEKILKSQRNLAETEQAVKWINIVLEVAERQKAGFLVQNSRLVRGMLLFARASLVKAKQEAGEPIEKDLELLQDKVDALKTMWQNNLNEDRLDGDLSRLGVNRSSLTSMGASSVVWLMAENVFAVQLVRELMGKEAIGSLDQAEELFSRYVKDFIAKEKDATGRERLSKLYTSLFGTAP